VTRRTTAPAVSPPAPGDKNNGLNALIARYGCGPVDFTGTDQAPYERRPVFDHVVAPEDARPREQFEAIGAAIRDVLSQRCVRTQQQIVGTHRTNGVAAIHSELLRANTVADFAAMFPERFKGPTLTRLRMADGRLQPNTRAVACRLTRNASRQCW
jgi:hypothetical protein